LKKICTTYHEQPCKKRTWATLKAVGEVGVAGGVLLSASQTFPILERKQKIMLVVEVEVAAGVLQSASPTFPMLERAMVEIVKVADV